MVRIALIGAGGHCRAHHAPALARHAQQEPLRLTLAAVCDLDRAKAEAVAEQFGFEKVYTDHRRMISEVRPDGCVCVMPIPLIVPLAKELMQMGMPTTVEKPPGASLTEARELSLVAARTGTPHMVSFNRRFDPLIVEARRWAQERGPVRHVRASMLRHARREGRFLSQTGIHALDALRFLAGDVAEARALPQTDGAPWCHVALRFASGAVGAFEMLTTTGCDEESYEICGEGYRVSIRVPPSARPHLLCWAEGELVVEPCPPEGQAQCVAVGAYGETAEFVSALIDKRPARPTVDDVLPSIELANRLEATVEGSKPA